MLLFLFLPFSPFYGASEELLTDILIRIYGGITIPCHLEVEHDLFQSDMSHFWRKPLRTVWDLSCSLPSESGTSFTPCGGGSIILSEEMCSRVFTQTVTDML